MAVPPPRDFWLKCHVFCAAVLVIIILMFPIPDLRWGLVTVLNWPVIVLTDSNSDAECSVLRKLCYGRTHGGLQMWALTVWFWTLLEWHSVCLSKPCVQSHLGCTAWTNHILQSDCTCQGPSFWLTRRMCKWGGKRADWAWGCSRRKKLWCFGSRLIFLNYHAAKKHLDQSQWLCRADVTSVSHNSINSSDGWQEQFFLCLSAPSVVWQKRSKLNCRKCPTGILEYVRKRLRWSLNQGRTGRSAADYYLKTGQSEDSVKHCKARQFHFCLLWLCYHFLPVFHFHSVHPEVSAALI